MSNTPLVVKERATLLDFLAAGVDCKVAGFFGDFHFLSNFHPSPIEFERILYPSVEHAYQAAKAKGYEERRAIAALASPGLAKKAGRRVALPADWEQRKRDVMAECVRLKFESHSDLRALLLETGEAELVEENTWGDRYWGACKGVGQNHLGRILMEERASIRARLGAAAACQS